MDPLTASVAVGAVSGIIQAYNSEKAGSANKKRLDELRKAFESIVPPDYDVSINDPPQYIQQALQGANLDFSRLTPETFKTVGQYSPEAAQFVAEKNPTLVQGSAAQKEGRGAQIEALRQMQSIAKGESPELKIKMQQAADQAQAQAQSRQQSILQDAQRRGQGTSGLSFAAMLQGSGDAMQQGAASSQNAALAAYKDKLAAIQGSGQMGRQLSQDELSQEGTNTDILNSFNQRTSRAYQDYLSQRAAMNNQAQLQNLNASQDIANRNTSLANQTNMFNLENKNKLAQQSYGNTVNERNYQDQIAAQKAQWAANEKNRQNNLKTQAYQNQLGKAQGMSGLNAQQMQQTTQQGQDQNAMIGALGGLGQGYFAGQAQQDAQKAAQDREDQRWDKYYNSRYASNNTQNFDKFGNMA